MVRDVTPYMLKIKVEYPFIMQTQEDKPFCLILCLC